MEDNNDIKFQYKDIEFKVSQGMLFINGTPLNYDEVNHLRDLLDSTVEYDLSQYIQPILNRLHVMSSRVGSDLSYIPINIDSNHIKYILRSLPDVDIKKGTLNKLSVESLVKCLIDAVGEDMASKIGIPNTGDIQYLSRLIFMFLCWDFNELRYEDSEDIRKLVDISYKVNHPKRLHVRSYYLTSGAIYTDSDPNKTKNDVKVYRLMSIDDVKPFLNKVQGQLESLKYLRRSLSSRIVSKINLLSGAYDYTSLIDEILSRKDKYIVRDERHLSLFGIPITPREWTLALSEVMSNDLKSFPRSEDYDIIIEDEGYYHNALDKINGGEYELTKKFVMKCSKYSIAFLENDLDNIDYKDLISLIKTLLIICKDPIISYISDGFDKVYADHSKSSLHDIMFPEYITDHSDIYPIGDIHRTDYNALCRGVGNFLIEFTIGLISVLDVDPDFINRIDNSVIIKSIKLSV